MEFTQHKSYSKKKIDGDYLNLFLAIFFGLLVVIAQFVAVFFLNLPKNPAIILGISLILVYATLLFFLLNPGIIQKEFYQEVIEKPVIKEVVREVPKEVIKEVPRVVVREVEKPVTLTKTIFVPQLRKKLDIPKYNYIGSSETMTYHTRNCRFRKLIKRKYQISNNHRDFFKRKNFRPCKLCNPQRKRN